MADPLAATPPEVAAEIRELGGDELLALVGSLVEDEEEYIVSWVDARHEDWNADEVAGWSVVDAVLHQGAALYVELSFDVSIYVCDEDRIGNALVPAFARVKLGPPLVADRLELAAEDLRAWIASETSSGGQSQSSKGFVPRHGRGAPG